MPIGRIGQDFIVNSTATGSQNDPSITVLEDGRFVATWSGPEIHGRLYNTDGTPAGNDFVVNSTLTNAQLASSVTGLANGGYVVTWESNDDTGDGSQTTVRARVFDADGSAVGNDFIVNTTTDNFQRVPAVTGLDDGRFFITWQSNETSDGSGGNLRGRFFDADGTPVDDDFRVNTTFEQGQITPSMATLVDGSVVVTWKSGDSGDGSLGTIRGRLFDADGSAAGDDFIVNSTTQNDQNTPSATALAGGGFVVTWNSEDNGDGDQDNVRGRVFDADGNAFGDDFIVNTTTTDNQLDPSVTGLADGRFVVTWGSEDTGDGSGDGIRGRLFDAAGSALGDDFIVNTTGTADQGEPSITALADGRFVATSRSSDTGDGDGTNIRAQIFDPTIFVGTGGQDTWSGGSLADRIHGYGDNDSFSGLGGNDMINGDAGNDVLDGGAGNDMLFGGLGSDTMIGGRGRDALFGNSGDDEFVFSSKKDSGKKANADAIKDFDRSDDLINLSAIDAKSGSGNQKFKWIGKQDFHDKKGNCTT